MKILYRPDQYSQQRQHEKPAWVYPVRLAMEATYHRRLGHEVLWDKEGPYDKLVTKPENITFLSLPYPDRVLTDAFNPRYQVYGNYLYRPATHFQVADGCWHGRCSFCVENGRGYIIRRIDHVLTELDEIRRLGFREAFDDSGTFPTGSWMDAFCQLIIRMNPGIALGCNMRICPFQPVNFDLMKQAGFRMILFGIESINQKTLEIIDKGILASQIEPTIRSASQAGLQPHLAFMYGYPWESAEDEARTFAFVARMLKKGYARTAQVSLYAPPTGCQAHPHGSPRRIYQCALSPEFWYHQFAYLKDRDNWIYLLRSIKKGIFHD